jgi:diguanylate cyclase (GGDEF)-like protein/PAS domain S-box-containing protein
VREGLSASRRGGLLGDQEVTMTESDDFYKTLLDHLHDGVYFVDRERRISYWNQAAERITGYGAHQVVGRHCNENILQHVDELGNSLCLGHCALSQAMDQGKTEEREAFLHHLDGHRVAVVVRAVPIRDGEGRIVGAVEIFSDDCRRLENRRRIAELESLAFADALTELANRRFTEITLGLSLDKWERYGWPFGVVLLDVDDFKSINDNHGHPAGDRVLQMVAKTLRGTSRPSDVVGRWGGDEFLAVLQNMDEIQLRRSAKKFEGLIRTSNLMVGGSEVSVTVSTGAALILPGDTVETIFQRADEALYETKNGRKAKGDGPRRFGPEIRSLK